VRNGSGWTGASELDVLRFNNARADGGGGGEGGAGAGASVERAIQEGLRAQKRGRGVLPPKRGGLGGAGVGTEEEGKEEEKEKARAGGRVDVRQRKSFEKDVRDSEGLVGGYKDGRGVEAREGGKQRGRGESADEGPVPLPPHEKPVEREGARARQREKKAKQGESRLTPTPRADTTTPATVAQSASDWAHDDWVHASRTHGPSELEQTPSSQPLPPPSAAPRSLNAAAAADAAGVSSGGGVAVGALELGDVRPTHAAEAPGPRVRQPPLTVPDALPNPRWPKTLKKVTKEASEGGHNGGGGGRGGEGGDMPLQTPVRNFLSAPCVCVRTHTHTHTLTHSLTHTIERLRTVAHASVAAPHSPPPPPLKQPSARNNCS
jgi:hypothetical protein